MSKVKIIIAIAIVVIVLAGAAFLVFRPAPTPVEPEVAGVVQEIVDEGEVVANEVPEQVIEDATIE